MSAIPPEFPSSSRPSNQQPQLAGWTSVQSTDTPVPEQHPASAQADGEP